MNQIAAGIILSYSTTYIVRFAVNCFTNAVFNKTTKVVKNKASNTWNYITNKKIEKEPIEYELIDLNRKEDEKIFVTSKSRLSDNWAGVDFKDNKSVITNASSSSNLSQFEIKTILEGFEDIIEENEEKCDTDKQKTD